MKILLLAVLSLNVQNFAVLPEEVQYVKELEYRDGKFKRRDRRKKAK